MNNKFLNACRISVFIGLLAGAAWAQTTEPTGAGGSTTPPALAQDPMAQRSLSGWLMRMHQASRRRAYIGTFVVSSGNHMATSRIWHVCDGQQQMERVESLTGPPRSTFRHNDQVLTFVPQSKVAVSERRESLGLFPGLLKSGHAAMEQFYAIRQVGVERVAGFESDLVQIEPRDRLRFGYRIWSERKTGLVMKLQTLDFEGQVLEQAAFSELEMDAPVDMRRLSRMMARTEGYRIEKPELLATTAAAEGWVFKNPVPGFESMSCHRRQARTGQETSGTVQWVFSDGLASVSLFIEVYDRRRHVQEGLLTMGATHALAQRVNDRGGEWWLTAVGEVPARTLQAFAQGLERKK